MHNLTDTKINFINIEHSQYHLCFCHIGNNGVESPVIRKDRKELENWENRLEALQEASQMCNHNSCG